MALLEIANVSRDQCTFMPTNFSDKFNFVCAFFSYFIEKKKHSHTYMVLKQANLEKAPG